MHPSQVPSSKKIRAIIFDMDNTLFDFVAAKQHACREVAKYLGRDDWEALFTCFLTSPHGFESHENLKDYFDLCGLLEECSIRKDAGAGDEGQKNSSRTCSITDRNCSTGDDGRNRPLDVRPGPPEDSPSGFSAPPGGNVVRIRISQAGQSPAGTGTPPPEARKSERRVTVPSACGIPPETGFAPQIPGVQGEERTGTPAGSTAPGEEGPARPPRPAIRDNLLADRSLYCNEVFSRCCEIYEAEKVRVLTPYPGVRETLAELKRQGLPLAIVTDAHNGNALTRLTRTGLSEFFDHVISYEMTGAKKPAPDAFLLALQKLGTEPSETLLVGDSLRRDIAPAQALGMITAYAKYGDRNVRGRDPPDCRADFVLGDIRELVKLI